MVFKKQSVDPIAEAEQQVADLAKQIEQAKQAAEKADAAATSAVLAGKDVDAAVSAAGKTTALLRALEAAKTATNERVVALRRQHAETESLETRQAAKPVMVAIADQLDGIEAEVTPLLARYSELVTKAESILEYRVNVIPALNALFVAAKGPIKDLAFQVRGSATSLLVEDPHGVMAAIAKRALAAAAVSRVSQ
jgi:hypothetical protein